MSPELYYADTDATLYLGDCREVLAGLDADSVEAVVTDPPYGLSFMGKDWDHGVPGVPFWEAVKRVAKPGAHMLAFGGTRTFHRLAVAIEDAGWEIRDTVMWVYGSGFPKSLDVSKAIDKAAGAEREVVGPKVTGDGHIQNRQNGKNDFGTFKIAQDGIDMETAPATEAAEEWGGWGTALKPAWEPIIVARKPLAGTVAENVQEHGTGALNVDGCRVEAGEGDYDHPGDLTKRPMGHHAWAEGSGDKVTRAPPNPSGRWPANLIHDGSDEVVRCFPDEGRSTLPSNTGGTFRASGAFPIESNPVKHEDAGGSAARFFYCAKADRADRTEGGQVDNRHPTVKPTDLMRYLCRLVTPPGGVVLDPFMGSGSTGKAALMEGFRFVGIEKDPDSAETAKQRLQRGPAAQRGLAL